MTLRRFRLAALVPAVLIAAAASAPAFAQYAWLDDKGIRQYSDRPPPPSVPASRILKFSNEASEPASSPAPPPGETASAPAAKAPMTLAEKNAAFRKRQAEQAEQEKKAMQQEKTAAEKARNCERARAYRRTLASGQRIAVSGKNGERAYLNDQQRAQELQDVQRMLGECK